ncbi:hypothetical protein NQ315_003687 [Exocentrus adspersus]|uniref:Helix-turn-helix domain-containing protein n=1 Tax=Exocentrus adspersus TaxID=1586481 RepID=A0AAV8V999_9CUCU|nr:hypothetical protein NQ315_003687 [Exocentrus adspersus]
MEKEGEDNSLPFLDMRVCRGEDNILRTKWYRKPMCSNRFINYSSYHSQHMKMNLVRALKDRVVKLSHRTHKNDSLGELRDILVENSYPRHLLNKILFNHGENAPVYTTGEVVVSGVAVGVQNSQINAEQVVFKSLPYIQELTPRLIELFREYNFRIALHNIKPVSRLFTKTKTPITDAEKSNIVYKIPCNNCNLTYVGQSSRTLKCRLTNHKSDCRLLKETSALAQHSTLLGHNMNFDGAEILMVESNYNKRCFLEMVCINNEEFSMNKRSDIENLSNIYTYLLVKVGKRQTTYLTKQ